MTKSAVDQKILNKIVEGAAFAGLGLFFSKVMAYLYRALVARWLGPEAYGQLNLGLTVIGIGASISLLALHQAVKRFVPEYREKGERSLVKGTIISALLITTTLSTITILVTIAAAPWIANAIFSNPELIPIIYILSISIVFNSINSIVLDALDAFKEVKYQVLSDKILGNIFQLIGTAILIYLGFDILGAAVGWVISSFVSAAAGLYFLEKKVGPVIFSDAETKTNVREIFSYSYPLVFSNMIGFALGWMDTAFLGYFKSSLEVGFYNAALPTAMLISMPFSALSTLALPSMSELMERDEDQVEGTLKTITRWTFYITFPAFTLMALFSEDVLHILFGREYIRAANALIILSFGYLFSSAVGPLDSLIKSLSETKVLLKNSVANLALNFILNILLIPKYGIIGAAIATTSSLVFVNVLLLIETHRFAGMHPFSKHSLIPIVSSLLGLTAAFSTIKFIFGVTPLWAMIPGGIIFGIVYLISLISLGGVKNEDKEIMRDAGTKYNLDKETNIVMKIINYLEP